MLIFLLPQNVEATTPCQVIHGTEWSLWNSDVVFFGHVTSTEDLENKVAPSGLQPYTIKFTVLESYKGFSNQTITLESDGFFPYSNFVEGNDYLVYAVNYSGVLRPLICSDITKDPNIVHLSKLRAFSITEPSVLAQESINVMSGYNPYFALLIVFGIIIFFSLIFYFATWVIVKKILHKRHPKLIGVIVVIVVYVIWITVTQFQSIIHFTS